MLVTLDCIRIYDSEVGPAPPDNSALNILDPITVKPKVKEMLVRNEHPTNAESPININLQIVINSNE